MLEKTQVKNRALQIHLPESRIVFKKQIAKDPQIRTGLVQKLCKFLSYDVNIALKAVLSEGMLQANITQFPCTRNSGLWAV